MLIETECEDMQNMETQYFIENSTKTTEISLFLKMTTSF